MILSQTAEYALRAVAWIAVHGRERPVLARDLSRSARIPRHYLPKILRRLVQAGVLVSRKGRGGGFALARPAAEIRFREVLVAVDAYPEEGHCAFGLPACNPSRPCLLHGSWSGVRERLREWAEETRFASTGGPAPRRTRRGPGDLVRARRRSA